MTNGDIGILSKKCVCLKYSLKILSNWLANVALSQAVDLTWNSNASSVNLGFNKCNACVRHHLYIFISMLSCYLWSFNKSEHHQLS